MCVRATDADHRIGSIPSRKEKIEHTWHDEGPENSQDQRGIVEDVWDCWWDKTECEDSESDDGQGQVGTNESIWICCAMRRRE